MTEPTVNDLDLAAQRAQFEALNTEWNALDRSGTDPERQAACARELRACGLRISMLERLARRDDYTNGQSHVKVGT